MGFLSLKSVLISTGVLSMAMALKLTVPVLSDFVVSEGPSIWTFFLTWLRPPYLYILLNCIILTIVAFSKLHHHSPADTQVLPTVPVNVSGDMRSEYIGFDGPYAVVLPPVQSPSLGAVNVSGGVQRDYNVYNGIVSDGYVYNANVPEKTTLSNDTITNSSDDAILAPSPALPTPTSLQRENSFDFAFPNENEKPLVSARVGHRKAVKAGPEGGKGALGVAKPKRQDTLESTWRTITEGRAMPLTRHLKKSDAWDSQPRRSTVPLTDQNGGTPPNPKAMKKSETFGGRENSASPGSGVRLRKEPSLSQDELNRRVEAFINKFNEEMRLQRQESLRQYREMIGRGAH